MIYTITSRRTEIGDKEKIPVEGPFHVKVPGRDIEDHPLLGFTSRELGGAFMKMKSFSTAEFRIVPLDDLLNENNKTQPILVYENEQQILDVEKNSEGYDYESLIRQNTL